MKIFDFKNKFLTFIVVLGLALLCLWVFYIIVKPLDETDNILHQNTETDEGEKELLKTSKPCRLQVTEYGHVCVCDVDYCDTLDVPEPSESNEYVLVTSSESGERFSYFKGMFSKGNLSDLNCSQSNATTNATKAFIQIDQSKTYQIIIGFGGAFTGAVSYILDQLPQELRECIYKSYYSFESGMGYNLMRIPIGSSDFDLAPWAYNEYGNDATLSYFIELDRRDKQRNAQIKNLSNVSGNHEIKILAALWNPPHWMKTNNDTDESTNHLKPECYQILADYHLKWIDFMQNDGVPVWAISTGNDPKLSVFDPFIGITWEPEEQSEFLSKHLGPTLNASKYQNVQIHGYDDSRINSTMKWFERMQELDSDALDYISAIDFHIYMDNNSSSSILDEVHEIYPDKPILYSEYSFGTKVDPPTHPLLGYWTRAESLIENFIENFKHHVTGYIDWNLVLNSVGGPTHSNNTVDASIISNENFTQIMKQPLFYAMAHFSKFIPVDSIRIEANVCAENANSLQTVAFLRPDQKVTVILYNSNPQEAVSIEFVDSLVGKVSLELKPKSVNTLIYKIAKK